MGSRTPAECSHGPGGRPEITGSRLFCLGVPLFLLMYGRVAAHPLRASPCLCWGFLCPLVARITLEIAPRPDGPRTYCHINVKLQSCLRMNSQLHRALHPLIGFLCPLRHRVQWIRRRGLLRVGTRPLFSLDTASRTRRHPASKLGRWGTEFAGVSHMRLGRASIRQSVFRYT